DRAALPGRVQWRLQPAWLGLRGALAADCCTAQPLRWQARIARGGGTLALADGASRWPAALLMGLGTPWNTLAPQGQLALSTQDLRARWAEGRLQVDGTARLEALRMSSRLSTLQPMGSYRITMQGGAATTLRLETIEGALLLSGSGQWVGSRLHFGGEASAAPGREAALSNLLNIIGRRQGARSRISIG
ncbi:type II secretion system protein N, partial [Ramlibacter sp. H39-3-26]|uniref:type II secretion system protein N n=1 Tax=Curvibacter soli TaxID=3031331 RepID=UPI0023D9A783